MNFDPSQQANFVAQLRSFRERLLHIDTRNPSLRLSKIIQKRNFDLSVLGPEVMAKLLERVVRGSGRATLVKDRDDADQARTWRRHLEKLAREAAARYDESGLRDLYLGLIWLEGHLDERVYVRGPLVLIPVSLNRQRTGRSPGWGLEFDGAEDPLLNAALLAAMRKHRGVVLDDGFSDQLTDLLQSLREAKSYDLERFQTRLGRLFIDAGLPVALEPVVTCLELQPRRNADIPKDPVPLTIRSHTAVGLFPQSNTALYADIEEMAVRAEQGETDQGSVDNLLEAPADDGHLADHDVSLDELSARQVYTVVPSDPSQYAIVAKAQHAECTVVRGPPGTGKSQVIVNLIADALARKQRVLVACQKRAALDVVFERLSSCGLGDFAYVVHDAHGDRPAMYSRLKRVLDQRDTRPGPSPWKSARTAEEIDRLVASIRSVVEPLNRTTHGSRLYRIYERAEPGFHSSVELPASIRAQELHTLEALLVKLDAARPNFAAFDANGHPIKQRRPWSDLSHMDRAALLERLKALATVAADPTPGLVLDDRGRAAQVRQAASDYVRLRRTWYRHFLPRWWRSRRVVEENRPLFQDQAPDAWNALLDRGQGLGESLRALDAFMSPPWVAAMVRAAERPTEIGEQARMLASLVDQRFDSIAQHDRVRASLSTEDLSLVDLCLQRLGSERSWHEPLLQEALLRWIDEAEQAHPALRGQPFDQYEQDRRQLVDLIDRFLREASSDIAADLRQAALVPSFAPGLEMRGNRKASTEWNKLAHEVSKRRRLKPIRSLIKDFPWPMKCCAPCWLASPEVVSEIFPLERGLFDLVIFDEASQLTIERALPVLYRARRTVIAGDEQQMPPSNFFSAALGEEEDEDDGEDPSAEARHSASLLEQAKRVYGFDYLAWHYRSRFQELIDFSNHAFYDSHLNIAANVQRRFAAPPIRFLRVDGTWKDKKNLVEARRAVDMLAGILKSSLEDSFKSVGVITFNIQQQTAIFDEISRRADVDTSFAELWSRAQSPASGRVDDKPFVKNIENVQGDERDIIIFSVGYAKDETGRLYKRFGPLGQSGGENRLNVAVTRAREAMVVLCSFDPGELEVSRSKNEGPRLFKAFLEYARTVGATGNTAGDTVAGGLGPSARPSEVPVKFETMMAQAIHDRLLAKGYEVDVKCGVGQHRVDLGVVDPRDPSRYCLGIECEGPALHQATSVRERDVARRAFLEARGWTLTRVWIRDWWRSPDAVMTKVVEQLPAVVRRPSLGSSHAGPPSS